VTKALKELVARRAKHCCEYCQLPQADSPLANHHVEHIRPRKHGGTDDAENLALACIDCNLHKGSNLAGIDPETAALTLLFHPRLDRWAAHFIRVGPWIQGITAIGRTTANVLCMNSDDQIELRSIAPASPRPTPPTP
jgi:HNH endonuclease